MCSHQTKKIMFREIELLKLVFDFQPKKDKFFMRLLIFFLLNFSYENLKIMFKTLFFQLKPKNKFQQYNFPIHNFFILMVTHHQFFRYFCFQFFDVILVLILPLKITFSVTNNRKFTHKKIFFIPKFINLFQKRYQGMNTKKNL